MAEEKDVLKPNWLKIAKSYAKIKRRTAGREEREAEAQRESRGELDAAMSAREKITKELGVAKIIREEAKKIYEEGDKDNALNYANWNN